METGRADALWSGAVQAGLRVDAQEEGHVDVVWERGRQADDADHLLRRLDEPQRARDQRLGGGAAAVSSGHGVASRYSHHCSRPR